MFIALEGIDASGKNTQANRLVDYLGVDTVKYSFPVYKTKIGEVIKQHLNKNWGASHLSPSPLITDRQLLFADALAFQALMAANRYEFATEIREKMLRFDVVADRYLGSGLAYGSADGIPLNLLVKMHESLPQPDLHIFVDVPVSECKDRMLERARLSGVALDRYEVDTDRLIEIRLNYVEIFNDMAKTDPGRWKIVNGVGPVSVVTDRIITAIALSYKQSEARIRGIRRADFNRFVSHEIQLPWERSDE